MQKVLFIINLLLLLTLTSCACLEQPSDDYKTDSHTSSKGDVTCYIALQSQYTSRTILPDSWATHTYDTSKMTSLLYVLTGKSSAQTLTVNDAASEGRIYDFKTLSRGKASFQAQSTEDWTLYLTSFQTKTDSEGLTVPDYEKPCLTSKLDGVSLTGSKTPLLFNLSELFYYVTDNQSGTPLPADKATENAIQTKASGSVDVSFLVSLEPTVSYNSDSGVSHTFTKSCEITKITYGLFEKDDRSFAIDGLCYKDITSEDSEHWYKTEVLNGGTWAKINFKNSEVRAFDDYYFGVVIYGKKTLTETVTGTGAVVNSQTGSESFIVCYFDLLTVTGGNSTTKTIQTSENSILN